MGKGAPKPDPAPVLEPLKTADAAIAEAKSDTARNQRMRAAIAGTFNRKGLMGVSNPGSTTTSGMGQRLGG